MIFNWFKQRRRTRILAKPFPESWNQIIRDNVVYDRHLTPRLQQRLRQLIPVFVAEKNWEGCGGLELTDEIKVTVAAQACLLVAGMRDNVYFDHVLSILIYPTGYVASGHQMSSGGLVLDGHQPRLGEAWWRGPVILSWSDALAGGRRESPGHNLVFHEFAHQLDMMNGRICDGTPVLETAEKFQRWISILGPEFNRLVETCRHGHRGFLDCYGATNPAEFFAVITEAFFDRPETLRIHHAEAYSVLCDFYQLNPAEWFENHPYG